MLHLQSLLERPGLKEDTREEAEAILAILEKLQKPKPPSVTGKNICFYGITSTPACMSSLPVCPCQSPMLSEHCSSCQKLGADFIFSLFSFPFS